MRSPPGEFSAAAAAIAADGWYLLPGLLSPTQTRALAGECRAMHEAGQLKAAATGANRTTSSLRGDLTGWFVAGALSAPQQAFSDRLDQLRQALNRELMLGLVDSESHYAVYRPGTGYGRHLDRLRGDDARVVSAVFYLNEDWRPAEGGALRLYLADRSHRDIYPCAGDLLLSAPSWSEHAHFIHPQGASVLTVQDHPLHIGMESLIWQERMDGPILTPGSEAGQTGYVGPRIAGA